MREDEDVLGVLQRCGHGRALMVSVLHIGAADNGTLQWYDYKTGYNFQKFRAPPQPGSLESECGVYAVRCRLVHVVLQLHGPRLAASPSVHPIPSTSHADWSIAGRR
jgi:hypothetical protein